MGRAHRYAGAAVVLVFLATGVYLKFGHPWGDDANEVVRYLYRANHVYILLAGLVNLGIGIYWRPRAGRRPRALQTAGSALVLAAPAVLVAAFFLEPPRPSPERLVTGIGMILLLLGTIGHAASGRPTTPDPS